MKEGRAELRAHVQDLAEELSSELLLLDENVVLRGKGRTILRAELVRRIEADGEEAAAKPFFYQTWTGRSVDFDPERLQGVGKKPSWKTCLHDVDKELRQLRREAGTFCRDILEYAHRLDVARMVTSRSLASRRPRNPSSLPQKAPPADLATKPGPSPEHPSSGELLSIASAHQHAEYLARGGSVWLPLGPWAIERVRWLLHQKPEAEREKLKRAEAAAHVSDCLALEKEKAMAGTVSPTLARRCRALGLPDVITGVGRFMAGKTKHDPASYDSRRLGDALRSSKLGSFPVDRLSTWVTRTSRERNRRPPG